jgi:hypothetical protein
VNACLFRRMLSTDVIALGRVASADHAPKPLRITLAHVAKSPRQKHKSKCWTWWRLSPDAEHDERASFQAPLVRCLAHEVSCSFANALVAGRQNEQLTSIQCRSLCGRHVLCGRVRGAYAPERISLRADINQSGRSEVVLRTVRPTDQPLTRPGATTNQQRDATRRAGRGASAPAQATAPGRVQRQSCTAHRRLS